MKKQVKKLTLAKETLANLGDTARKVRGGIELYTIKDEYTRTCITCFASCENTDCYCPGTADCSKSCQICVPF